MLKLANDGFAIHTANMFHATTGNMFANQALQLLQVKEYLLLQLAVVAQADAAHDNVACF
jgi:hypothetical protein